MSADPVAQIRALYSTHPILMAAADEIEQLRIRVLRLEGYSEGLRETLTNVRRAAGCSHD